MRLNLKAKLLLAFFLLIAIPCTMLGYMSYRQAASALQHTIEEQLAAEAIGAAEVVSGSVHTAIKIVEGASNQADLIAAAATGDAAGARETLNMLKVQNADIMEDVFVTDRSGQMVAYTADAALISVKEREYFVQAIAGKTVISDVLISKTTNRGIVVVAKPLKQDGQIIGILAAIISFDDLAKRVGEIKIGETGYGYIINNEALVVYHPNKDLVLKLNLLQHEGLKVVAQKMVEGKPGKGFYAFQGVEKLVAYAPADKFIVAITAPIDEYMAPAKAILWSTIITTVISILIALAIAFVVANSIVKPISGLRKLMGMAGEGDLTVISAIKSTDEIGDLSKSFDTMIVSQNNIVKHVRSASEQLAGVSEVMAASCEEVNSTGEEIAASMQGVASKAENGNHAMHDASKSLAHISQLIHTAQTKANAAADNSQTTFRAAEEGRAKVTETVNKMSGIKAHTAKTSAIITELNGYSQQIGNIVDTITAIAGQTNLLALNAAIEAARAGEHGRGFAVVAEEVRKLAEQSDNGAKEITVLIEQVREKTEQAVEAMSGGVSEVEQGIAAVNAAGSALDCILEAVKQTVKEIQEIRDVTREEVANSEEVVKLIDQLSAIVEDVAASCQEVSSGTEQQTATMQTIAASAEEASAEANHLKHLVDNFKV